jgi:hypothetical protein
MKDASLLEKSSSAIYSCVFEGEINLRAISGVIMERTKQHMQGKVPQPKHKL